MIKTTTEIIEEDIHLRWMSLNTVDELKKALKDEIPEFTSTVFDYDLHEIIDSVFAQHVQSLRSEHHDTHDGLEKEKVKDDINLSNVSSEFDNVAYFGVQPREIRELNKESFIKSNIELNKDIYDYDIQMEKKTTLQLLCDRDEDADTEWVRVENVINFCNKYPDLTLRYLKYLLPQSSEVLK